MTNDIWNPDSGSAANMPLVIAHMSYFNVVTMMDLKAEEFEEIGTAFSIGYVSTISAENHGYRAIKVTTRDSNLLIIQSRTGYILP